MIEDKEKQSVPSENVLAALEFLLNISATSPAYAGKLPDVVNPETILRSRENQWITLTDNLTKTIEENKLLEKSLSQVTEQVNALKEDLNKARSLNELLESAKQLFGEIHVTLRPVKEIFEKSSVAFYKSKDFIEKSVTTASKLASDGKSINGKTR